MLLPINFTRYFCRRPWNPEINSGQASSPRESFGQVENPVFREWLDCLPEPSSGSMQRIILEREYRPYRDYFTLIIYLLVWIGLFLGLTALIFASHIGFVKALKVSLVYWLFIIIVFVSILMLNLIYMIVKRILLLIKGHRHKSS